MGTVRLTNNATSILASSITSTDPSLNVAAADAAKFPVIAAGSNDWFPVVVVDAAGQREIMKCIGRAGATLTMQMPRGAPNAWAEGTTALPFTANQARVDVRLTAAAIAALLADAGLLTTGLVSETVLPVRLRSVTEPVPSNNANSVTVTGHYLANTTTTNAPVAGVYGYLWADVYNSLYQYQEWRQINSTAAWARRLDNGSWQSWYQLNMTDTGVPIGSIVDYGGPAAPAGWLLCYGQSLSRSPPYDKLFQALGGTGSLWGLPSGSTFSVPDLRGRVTAGQDDMGGSIAGRIALSADTINDMDGTKLGTSGGHMLHTLTDLQISAHVHTLSAAGKTATGGGDHQHTISGRIASTAGGFGFQAGSGVLYTDNPLTPAGQGDHIHNLTGTTDSIGGDKPHNNLQPTTITNKIIKFA
jgi:microcystin-dependent protein